MIIKSNCGSAENEHSDRIAMTVSEKTVFGVIHDSNRASSMRRLMDLGAITVVEKPSLGYGWTYDGLLMIKEFNKLHPGVLDNVREKTITSLSS